MTMTSKAHIPGPLSKLSYDRLGLWFAIAVAPFLLNDLANIFVHNFTTWIIIDYIFVKGFPLVVLIYLLRSRVISLADLGIKRLRFFTFFAWTISFTIIGLYGEAAFRHYLAPLFPNTTLGYIPWDSDSPLAVIDLYFGMLLVGIFEEIIFRGFAFTVSKRWRLTIPMMFILSSLLFGLIHWSLGLAMIVKTTLIGAIFMVGMWKTGSVVPMIVAHALMDFTFFAGIHIWI